MKAPRILIAGVAAQPETFLVQLAVGLAGAGYQVDVTTSGRCAHTGLRAAGVKVLERPCASGLRLSEFTALWNGLRPSPPPCREKIEPGEFKHAVNRIRFRWEERTIGQGRYGLVIFPWLNHAARFLHAVPRDTPTIVSCRGAQISVDRAIPSRQTSIARLKRVFAEANRVHCVSDAIAQEAAELGMPTAKSRTIRPAVDLARFRPTTIQRSSDEQSLHLVTTGSLIWRKGLEYLLIDFAKVVKGGCRAQLTIIGSGPERERIAYTVADMGIAEFVILTGSLPPEQVSSTLAGSHGFVFASLSEGISNAVLEGMACGLPVVTTACGGMNEAVTEGVEGFLVPPRDPAAMARAIERLAQDPELRARMGAAARERAVREFSQERLIAQWVELIEETLAEARSKRAA